MEYFSTLATNLFNKLPTDQEKMAKYALIFTTIAKGVKVLYDNYKCDLEFICGDEKFKQDVIENCPSLSAGVYYPTIYLPTPTMQMIYGCIQPTPQVKYELHEITGKDGQNIQFMICVDPKPRSDRNVVLIHHGHCGGAGINYIKKLAQEVN